MTTTEPETPARRPRMSGPGRILVVVYGILALAALGRSGDEIATKFSLHPVDYALSAVAAVVYVLATISLVVPGRAWYRVAWVTISFELVFVLVVGTQAVVQHQPLPGNSVWSYYGIGYLFIPLVLPVLGLLFLRSQRHLYAREA